MSPKMQLNRGYRKRFTRLIEKRKPRQLELNLGLQGRRPFEAWFKPDDVVKLKVTDEVIGGGVFGKIWIGRVYFKDGSSHQAAIKIFFEKINDNKAQQYQRVIEKLARAGIPIPKMSMIKWKNPSTGREEWVQVSQVFGSRKEIKKGNPKIGARVSINAFLNKKNISAVTDLFIKFANAGYYIPWDCLHVVNTAKGNEVMPLDMDLIVEEENYTLDNRIYSLAKDLSDISYARINAPNPPTLQEIREINRKILEQINNERVREGIKGILQISDFL